MNLKRAFAVFCALAAAVAFLPVHGAERITDVRYTVNDGFEDYTGGAPAGWTAYGGLGTAPQAGPIRLCPRPVRGKTAAPV